MTNHGYQGHVAQCPAAALMTRLWSPDTIAGDPPSCANRRSCSSAQWDCHCSQEPRRLCVSQSCSCGSATYSSRVPFTHNLSTSTCFFLGCIQAVFIPVGSFSFLSCSIPFIVQHLTHYPCTMKPGYTP